MKIKDIIVERQQQRTVIMYHGTSSKLVPSILKNGLLARPPKKTYDVDTFGAETESMGGVYVAADPEFAKTISREAVEAHGGEPALVTLQYVKNSADIDEDDLVAAIGEAADAVMKQLSRKAPMNTDRVRDFEDTPKSAPSIMDQYSSLSYPQQGWATDVMIKSKDRAAKQIAAQAIETLSRKFKPRRAAEPLIEEIAKRLLIAAGKETDARDRWTMVRTGAYDIVRPQMESLLAKLMRQVSPDSYKYGARRIDRDVKFKGKTRILKIEIGNRQVYPQS